MATDQLELEASLDLPEDLQYRALSTGAVVSVVLGVLSAMTIPAGSNSLEYCLAVCPVPLIGLFVGFSALRKIRRYPQELTGQRLAWTGMLLSAGFLFGGLGYATFVYATEVPSGYERIAFTQMKPDEHEQMRRMVVPEDILKLHGQKVFIKGYMRPSSQRYQLDSFLLVRDSNECCFGDLSKVKYYDQMLVQLKTPLRADYSTRMFRLAGTLEVNPDALYSGSGPVFALRGDYVK